VRSEPGAIRSRQARPAVYEKITTRAPMPPNRTRPRNRVNSTHTYGGWWEAGRSADLGCWSSEYILAGPLTLVWSVTTGWVGRRKAQTQGRYRGALRARGSAGAPSTALIYAAAWCSCSIVWGSASRVALR
jgi:hypothetical protein